jgi:hypothetical protein
MERAFSPRFYFVLLSWGAAPGWDGMGLWPARHTPQPTVADEIQTHSAPIIQRCYSRFLLENGNPDDREYEADADQIREVLIHKNYLSPKDIEICAAFEIAAHDEFEMHLDLIGIESLHKTLQKLYANA